ncbi:MAG: D-glycerate dehydrogenase [Armatimonadetes bacterium]|nr:D-glycerate dehydrogenase [Armatimonadota bacterium]
MGQSYKVWVTRRIPEAGIEMLREAAEVEVWEDELPPPRDLILDKIGELDGILALLTDRMDAAVMDRAKKLKVIANYAVGFDNVDVPAATERGILVTNTPGVLTETTADLAFTLLMATARHIVPSDRYTREGRWKTWGPMLFLGQDIHHAALGLIGLGRIGAEVAKRARGFDMRVRYFDPIRNEEAERRLGIEYADLDTILKESDFVSLHTPLTPETRHLIGARELALMKPTAILINTSRGPVVDQKALYEALKNRTLYAAGLDVFDVEPVPKDEPLLSLDNVVAVPHIASASFATRTRMATLAAENLLAGLRGTQPPTPVNPEVLSAPQRRR